jgi:hypothetical protein
MLVQSLKKKKPELLEYGAEVYAKYAVSKLQDGVTTVNKLVFKTSINHYKKFVYINLELHWKP